MRFRILALGLALSVGVTGLVQAASKTTTVVGSERPKAKKAKKVKPSKATKQAKAGHHKAPKSKHAKHA